MHESVKVKLEALEQSKNDDIKYVADILRHLCEENEQLQKSMVDLSQRPAVVT